MVYLISYDLESASKKDYDLLEDGIMQVWSAIPLLDTQWLIRSDSSAEKIKERILGFNPTVFARNASRLVVNPFDLTTSDWHHPATDPHIL